MLKEFKDCPVCQGNHFTHFLNCTDHTTTQEQFNIVTCDDCGFKFTNPYPANLAAYYKDESYISHTNKAQNLTQRIYKIARKYTLGQKEKMVSGLSDGRKILDFGCGTGHFLNKCAESGWQVQGLEPSDQARSQHGPLLQGKIVNSIDLLSDEKVDIITLWHVLEHIEALNETLDKLRQKLCSTGKLLLAVPNAASLDAKIYQEHWAAYDLPRHLYHFEPQTMALLAKKHGFKISAQKPMKLDSFYVSLLSEEYKTGKQNYLPAFMAGLKSNLAARKDNNYSSLIYILEHESK